jgi:ribonuclease E
MPNKMLIDATHPEETRVVVLRGNRVEEFDFESANRKQLRGNIYLAKVTRVEPSLQAAFVDYGGNRHGFLAFSEIHPDYYQIPIADRQALIAAQERAHRDDEAEHERRSSRRGGRHRGRSAQRRDETVRSDPPSTEAAPFGEDAHSSEAILAADEVAREAAGLPAGETGQIERDATENPDTGPHDFAAGETAHDTAKAPAAEAALGGLPPATESETAENAAHAEDALAAEAASHPDTSNGHSDGQSSSQSEGTGEELHPDDEAVESVGGADALEEAQERAPRVRTRQYKIQEVIKRRQVMLVQVVKEERGTKGAALTTYLSLAGRYCVLMPNTARGGGISRKITSSEDRNRLKEIAQDLEVPEGMGVILRTAGASRTKTEVKRDFEYLLRLWETVRDLTLKSTAPKLVYEEGSLTKRSIRDLYNKDIDEIIVAGEEGYKDAKEFMRMLMPGHAKNVKLYRDTQPVFTRFGIENQLDAMFSPTVQLRSGGYIVINQAEALVAIDVNSGRSTREHHIEDTALKTNSEAAEEVARQLRLRDLAGLIVIDFIDMDEGRNNRAVERRLKEALKHDRARIQVGRISHFGLMEMSRQRIRTSVLESSTEKCPVCGGSGHVRSVSSVTLALLRAIEELLIKGATHNLIVRTRPEVALYILNQKRGHLRSLEERFRVAITVNADATVVGTQSFMVDRGEQVHTAEAARSIAAAQTDLLPPIVEDEDEVYVDDADAEAEAGAEAGHDHSHEFVAESEDEGADAGSPAPIAQSRPEPLHEGGDADGGPRRRRRGGRGRGRGRGRNGEGRGEGPSTDSGGAETRGDGSFVPETVAEHAVAHDDHDSGEPSEPSFDQPRPAGIPTVEGGEGDRGPRRRRRGRRGGRRNRGRNGDNGFAANDSQAGQNGQRSEGSYERPAASQAQPAAYAPAPVEMPRAEPTRAETPRPAAVETDAPRRRSTIREPASFAADRAPTSIPAAVPVVSSTAIDEPAQPKRGWWGKRLLGGKD